MRKLAPLVVDPLVNYAKIERDVGAIITRGAGRLKEAYQRQVLITNWEVGRYLNGALPLDDRPSAANARLIARLSKKFNRTDGYFYSLIKFYRLYPALPRDKGLSWSHYEALLRVGDPGARRRYERLAVRKDISGKLLYRLIVNDKAGDEARKRDGRPAVIPLKRGRLYHYRVAAPKNARSNTGTVTLDIGFNTYRDIPLSRNSRLFSGSIVRTVKSETARSIFGVKNGKNKKDRLYTYKAGVHRVIDGDTLIAMIDLGLKTKTRQKLRLRGIDAPEITTQRGLYVRDYVRMTLDRQKFVVVKTYRDDKWGRMLADVFYKTGAADPDAVAAEGIFLNQELVDQGLAEIWK